MDEFQGCFGSLVKEKDHWLLRLYNNEIEPVSCGIIHSDEPLVFTQTTLDHAIHKPLSNELEPLRKGELRMIQIERK